jgi:hypothetical protein
MKAYHINHEPIRIDIGTPGKAFLRSTVPFTTGHEVRYCAGFAHAIYVDRGVVVRAINPEAVGTITVRPSPSSCRFSPNPF